MKLCALFKETRCVAAKLWMLQLTNFFLVTYVVASLVADICASILTNFDNEGI